MMTKITMLITTAFENMSLATTVVPFHIAVNI